MSRFASGAALNAPWGIAVAPTGFGSIAGDVLIGNFGDGKINIFTPNGKQLSTSVGSLTGSSRQALSFPGLWSLVFGNGDTDRPVTTLFYTAGFANQTDGVFGSIATSTTTTTTPAPAPAGLSDFSPKRPTLPIAGKSVAVQRAVVERPRHAQGSDKAGSPITIA